MAGYVNEWGWGVTDELVAELIRRIIVTADPLQIILFGSRARGDYRPDSDLDLGVIVDCPQDSAHKRLPDDILDGIPMSVDLLLASKEKFDLYRPWMNSIYNYMDTEGIVLYDREHPESASPEAVAIDSGRRNDVAVRAA